jgi:hypothetical protein
MAFPPDNVYGIEPAVGTALVDGYALPFAPLSPGEHTLHFAFELPDGTPAGVTYQLTVAEPVVLVPAVGTPENGTPPS